MILDFNDIISLLKKREYKDCDLIAKGLWALLYYPIMDYVDYGLVAKVMTYKNRLGGTSIGVGYCA
jgi:hypothetical protein